jgi:hypothetical protein
MYTFCFPFILQSALSVNLRKYQKLSVPNVSLMFDIEPELNLS